jgi:hypothetical protein
MIPISSHPEVTSQRKQALISFFENNVFSGENVKCRNYQSCLNSHSGTFYYGQLHHIGNHYDLSVNGHPYRIMVVGQEYGHLPSFVDILQRHQMIAEQTGIEKTYSQRNPHMRGTTSALRLLFDLPPTSDHSSEFILIDGNEVHLFELFSLVNYLLCSALDENGTTHGKSSTTMKKNCQAHFIKVLEILDPNIIILQSKSFSKYIEGIFNEIVPITENLSKVIFQGHSLMIAFFSHPSAYGDKNWGRNTKTPYLLNTVLPTIERIRDIVLS